MAIRLTHLSRQPQLLPPVQLLACQPHWLLAAACALAAALAAGSTHKEQLTVAVSGLVVVLAQHRAMSGRMRSWLSPQPAATASDGGGMDGDPWVGCLAAPLQCFVRHTLSTAPTTVVQPLALLNIAAGQVKPKAGMCCEGGGDVTGEADGGSRQCAAAMAGNWWAGCEDPSGTELPGVMLPEGSDIGGLLARELEDQERLRPPLPPPAPPLGALPPPMALPPSRAGALPRLRVCGNPRCGNFAGDSEEALPLKQCGGCRAVRYCGGPCQREHWREGHRVECKELAAASAGA